MNEILTRLLKGVAVSELTMENRNVDPDEVIEHLAKQGVQAHAEDRQTRDGLITFYQRKTLPC